MPPPGQIGLRVLRNCSDRVPDDKMFVENLVKYKAYLMESGYASDRISKHFIKVAKLKRNDLLRGKRNCTNRKSGTQKINFASTWDPMFPNINQAIKNFSVSQKKMKSANSYFSAEHLWSLTKRA